MRLGDARQAVIAAERGRAVMLAESITVRSAMENLQSCGHGDLVIAYEAAAARLAQPSPALHDGDEPARVRTSDLGAALRTQAQIDLEAVLASIRSLGGFKTFMQRPSDDEVFARVIDAASITPVAYVMAAASGGTVLTVRTDGSISITDLPELTDEHVAAAVTSYVRAYDERNVDHGRAAAWANSLDETLRWLGETVGKTLLDFWAGEGIGRVNLVPMGGLGLLPLHAMWVDSASSQTTRRRYLLDEIDVAYLPNALAAGTERPSIRVGEPTLLAIEVSHSGLGERLHGTGLEVDAVASHFEGRAEILRDEAATKAEVLRALPGHTVVHFACHGLARWDMPLESSLIMAHGVDLTLGDILNLHLDGTRLVALSACETAFPGADLLDEVVSLPAGILQSGATAAIGSLWPVDDLSTMALFTRLYDLWLVEGTSLVSALSQAQRWVRDLTRQERDLAFPGVSFGNSGGSGSHPYAHPVFWAAFGLAGAS